MSATGPKPSRLLSSNRRAVYSHLAGGRRVPTDYQTVTRGLLYYPKLGFSIQTPSAQFITEHQTRDALTCSDWESFEDPHQITYQAYCRLRRDGELVHTQLLDEVPEFTPSLERIGCLRFLYHGLQMVSAYLGSMSPGSSLVLLHGFQAADHMRVAHRLSYRLGQYRQMGHDFSLAARAAWQRDASWQPCRRLVEELLTCYDFSQALVAMNLVVLPLCDEIFLKHWGDQLRASHDPLGNVLCDFHSDAQWHRDWSTHLVGWLLTQSPENSSLIQGWFEKWASLATSSLSSFGAEASWAEVTQWWSDLGLDGNGRDR